MALKPIQAACNGWLGLRGRNRLPKVVSGLQFRDGEEAVKKIIDNTPNAASQSPSPKLKNNAKVNEETMLRSLRSILAILPALLVLTAPAMAHTGGGLTGGFIAGLSHPISGLDHVAAMVAVGLWSVFLGAPAIWLLPIVFPISMALGGVLGVAGIDVPSVEIGIALSAVVLGLCVAFALKPHFSIAATIVAAFAIFHGHAHGTELPAAADAYTYAAGFVIATGLLHAVGIAFGLLARWNLGKVAVRTGGGIIALAGVAFLSGIA